MGGAFLNDGTGGGTYDATSDYRVHLSFRTDGAFYSLFKCLNAACSSTTGLAGLTPIPTSASHPLGIGTVHTVTQGWDAATKTLSFQLDDAQYATTVLSNVAAPKAPYVPMKYFQTQVSIPGGNSGAQASVEGTVKNVWVHP